MHATVRSRTGLFPAESVVVKLHCIVSCAYFCYLKAIVSFIYLYCNPLLLYFTYSYDTTLIAQQWLIKSVELFGNS